MSCVRMSTKVYPSLTRPGGGQTLCMFWLNLGKPTALVEGTDYSILREEQRSRGDTPDHHMSRGGLLHFGPVILLAVQI